MKLSNISIIFIIIMIPVIIVLSYYISMQIDTINMQTAYTTKQLEATKEAIEAFEINTVEWNESYSENADSKRRDIMASINTFTTSFANSIGIGGTNKEHIETYIPAIACTLYDGYYIYAPSEIKEVIKDGNGVAVFLTENIVESNTSPIEGYNYNDDDKGKLLYKCKEGATASGTYNGERFTFDASDAETTYDHILKPYSTYSARYKNGDLDITVNYTLDNYITVYGTINGEYVAESGYLICDNNISKNQDVENLTEKIAWKLKDDETYTCKTYKYVYAEDKTKVYFEEEEKIDGDGNSYTEYIPFQVSSTNVRTNLSETTSIKYKKRVLSENKVVYQALNNGTVNIKKENGQIEPVEIKQGTYYVDKQGTEIMVSDGISNITMDFSAINYYIESIKFTKWVNKNLSDISVNDLQIEENEKTLYGNLNDKIFEINSDNNPEEEGSIFFNHKREVIKQNLISNLNQSITSYSHHNTEGEYNLPVLTETDWDNVLRNVSIITFVQNIPIGMKYYNNYSIATSTSNKEYVNPEEIYLYSKTDIYYHLPYCSELSNENFIIGYRNIDYVSKTYKNGEDTVYYYRHSDNANQLCYYCLVQRDLYNTNGFSDIQDKAYNIALARERYNINKTMGYNSTVENRYEDSVEVKIIFNDVNNNDGIRPQSISAKLVENIYGETKEILIDGITSNTESYSYKWENVQQYKNGYELQYNVETPDIAGYQKSYIQDGNYISITYTHEPEKVERNVKSTTQKDGEGYKIKVILYKEVNGIKTAVEEITLSNNESSSYNWKNLYKYSNGQEIIYSIESIVQDNSCTITGTTYDDNSRTWEITCSGNIFYLYKAGTEYVDWETCICSDFHFEPKRYTGAIYSKEEDYLRIGDDSTTAYADGAVITLNGVKDVNQYNKITVKFKVKNSKDVILYGEKYYNYLILSIGKSCPHLITYKDKANGKYQELSNGSYKEIDYKKLRAVMIIRQFQILQIVILDYLGTTQEDSILKLFDLNVIQ